MARVLPLVQDDDRPEFVVSFTANGSDSKKLRVEDGMDNPPSRVIHIRKLPNEVSETEVIALGLPFGKVTNILMLKGKNQVMFLSDRF